MNIDPMTAAEAADYIPQWGSYITSSDPGYIAYTAIPPERAAHRDEMVRYLEEHCLSIAQHNGAPDPEDGPDDAEEIARAVAYLKSLAYAPDIEFIASSFGGGWVLPMNDTAREYLEELLGEAPAPMLPIGGDDGWIIEPAELRQFRDDVAADGMTILEA